MSQHSPFFSVIIPAHNREKLVGAALCSVVAQTFTDWECIVVDDGSTDGTRVSVQLIHGILKGVAEKEKTKVPDIQVIRQANGGPGAARNHGAAQARGKYLAFLDSDDVWFPWTLKVFREALAGGETLLMAHTLSFASEDELSRVKQEPVRIAKFRDALAAGVHGFTPGAGMSVVLAEAFRQSGGYWPQRQNCEDHDLVMRMGVAPGFAAIEAPVTLGYRRHGVQETEVSERTVEGLLRLIAREKAGEYPGGPERGVERRAILCAHVRPACVACLRAGRVGEAWSLYTAAFRWQRAAGRWRFLAGFFIILAATYLRRLGASLCSLKKNPFASKKKAA